MGRIRKKITFSVILSLLVLKSLAQEVDTIYIIDYWANFGSPIESKSKFMQNDGATVILSTGDTVFLKATYESPILKLRSDVKEGFVEGRLKIQTLRIVKPRSAPLSIRIQSNKNVSRQMSASVDTTLNFDGVSASRPYVFINLMRHHYSFTKKTRLEMKVSNRDFIYKNNFKRKKVVKAIIKSVKYEYHLPEKKLSKVTDYQ